MTNAAARQIERRTANSVAQNRVRGQWACRVETPPFWTERLAWMAGHEPVLGVAGSAPVRLTTLCSTSSRVRQLAASGIDSKHAGMTHDLHAQDRAAQIPGVRRTTLVALLLGALLLAGCATGRSVQETVSGWFHRDGAQTPAASKAPAKRKAKAPAAEAAAPEPAPDEAATGTASEPPPEAEPPAPPEEPKKTEPSVFDPY
jgi:hypothetical protein